MNVVTRLLSPTSGVRVLDHTDLDEVLELLAHNPVDNAFIGARVETAGLDQWQLGGEMWGHYTGGRLTSLCFSGANLVPINATSEAVRAFADRARRQGRRCSSIVGPRGAALDLWSYLAPHWHPAREVRPNQPVMALREPSATVPPDFRIRAVHPAQLDVLMPACVAMFTEEVGVSPVAADGGRMYRQRVAELINAGRAFAWIDNDEVVFKAEIGAVTRAVCQIQGVWVNPRYRGRRISEGGMAAVVEYALRDFAPVVSLYVNDFNLPARASYHRVGFRDVSEFASVLF
ncbi:MAG TPA: GNAT family N-acetyltransferase [Actinocrinis sp.]|uniref:GNAT family N-acetyltransferase n=1 Tax=Actinocrinis sp. TaxID=1920516 RepID=UPI002DDD722B|nr:GNAT family N-acetyltransferase [Actinocrinis sp.]HEV2344929.1 GNAT family N-acetyltransferase [Actinocrinis sp.]